MATERETVTLDSSSAADTERIGDILGRHLSAGDVVALEGTLGSGKTTLIRGLARGLGVPEAEISSPTFVFVHEHRGRVPLIHIDLYRVEDSGDLPDLGLLEYLATPCVVAVEWSERAAGFLPPEAVTIRFSDGNGESNRRLALSASAPRLRAAVRRLEEEYCGNKPSMRS